MVLVITAFQDALPVLMQLPVSPAQLQELDSTTPLLKHAFPPVQQVTMEIQLLASVFNATQDAFLVQLMQITFLIAMNVIAQPSSKPVLVSAPVQQAGSEKLILDGVLNADAPVQLALLGLNVIHVLEPQPSILLIATNALSNMDK